ncbi:DUF3667 domain-containing protein [uncultured Dokdonia sp.]|uniref:DUF3667 domain-containing protein n=1 Tax=uncultured Dokdonia sp. TaxID=575653 RepID=UPI0030EBAF38|tara:strand:+ start:62200 stop:63210 length:1011 start_codon:yes stop_codon:yes gene_type:complete
MSKLSRAEKKALKKKQNQLEVKDTCVNCEQFIALDQRFCSHCGGKRIYNKLTWRNLLEDFVDRFFNLENSFIKTFVAMFRQPEDVIGGYINGMRKKYLPAFSYFAIAITFTGFYYYLIRGWFWDNYMAAQTSLFDDTVSQEQIDFGIAFSDTVNENLSLYMFMIIPFLALISKLVFWNYKKYNLVEHFVIFLYTYSHISIISVALQLLFIWNQTILTILGFSGLVFMFAFSIYVLKKLFKLNTGAMLLKTLLFFIVISILSCFIISPLAVFAGYKIAQMKAKGEQLDENSLIGKFIKPFEEKALKQIKQDSIKQDSLKRLEYELEITPDMIKNRPQ